MNEGTRAETSVPDYISHYYLPGRRPFLNLSDLDELRLQDVLDDLNTTGHDGVSERRFGARYMQLRRATESLLRDQFAERGG